MEQIAGGGAAALANHSLEDLDALWERVKRHEAGQVS